MLTHVLLAALTVALATASPSASLVQLEHAPRIPSHWRMSHHLNRELERLELTVAVRQENLAALEATLYAVSDPDSPQYGQHLSRAAVDALVAPSSDSVTRVIEWLVDGGVPLESIRATGNADFVWADVSVATAERLLHTRFAAFELAEEGQGGKNRPSSQVRRVVRVAEAYHLPAGVAEVVDFVSPTVRFPAAGRTLQVHPPVAEAKSDALFVTPALLHALYNVTGSPISHAADNVQAFASFLEQYYSPTDLATFWHDFVDNTTSPKPIKAFGNATGFPGTEANLDSQYLTAVGANVTTWAYYTAGRAPGNPENEPFLAWMKTVAAQDKVPNVISVSYGDVESTVSFEYAQRINTEFAKVGTRGVSLLIASGDSGVGPCENNEFAPNFPTDSPYVTSVGGLFGGTAGKFPTGEVADSISGGGFSNYWARPSYQDHAVTAYLKNTTGLPKSSQYNTSAVRAYPDVAAQSEGFLVVQFGIPMPVGGTSAATPTVAGVISLLNSHQLANNKSPLGFLNPWLYKRGRLGFSDVVDGYNMGCGEGLGFPSRAGWDPVTGFGSPNYGRLLELLP